MSKGRLVILIVFIVLLVDQTLKLWIKSTMMIGEEYHIFGNWFILHFTENNGMAFGLELGGSIGKYFLSIFRIVAVGFIAYYISRIVEKNVPTGFLIAVSLIFAGATGNIIDSAFYGLVFDHSYYQVAHFFAEQNYASFLQGRVVDMLYFPVIKGHWPTWSPINPSEPLIFFRPVFNIADSAITCGMFIIILFHRGTLQKEL
ncbi:MAG: lipoprotein signal peptidase [Salinivirgaceae bacterium]|jgi:signal peptidase II|nr:lipoprotein signal peptidase [Salinivirgaceae bacterium]